MESIIKLSMCRQLEGDCHSLKLTLGLLRNKVELHSIDSSVRKRRLDRAENTPMKEAGL